MNRILTLAAAVALLITARSAPAAFSVGDLSRFNLITIGDLETHSDVQGRVLVGGTLRSNAFTFGGQAGSIQNAPPTFLGSPINGVFSAIDAGVTTLNTNGLPASSVVYGSYGGPGLASATQNAAAVDFFTSGLSSALTGLSESIAGLAPTGMVDASDRNQIKFLDPTNAGEVSVFSVGLDFFASGGTITQLEVGSATTVIVNVVGAGVLNASSGLQYFQNFQDSANILFNMVDATEVNGINNLGASLLAPRAVLNTNATLRGGIYVGSVANVGEIDLPSSDGRFFGGYTGFVPTSMVVPEPSSAVLFGTAASVLAVVGWRRRQGSGR
ncbi:collagen-binding domain-containing protein [Tautonia sociabilis]|nr:collagen-binding domain-containing protein [Tautonia sociabilis]